MNKDFAERFVQLPETKPKESIWNEYPWFAIAKWHGDYCFEVLLTDCFDAYASEWHASKENGIEITVWCGTYRDVDQFRERCQGRK